MSATIENLSTESVEVAMITAAHNAAAGLAKGGNEEAAAKSYGKLFKIAYDAIVEARKSARPTPGSPVAG
jgi:hypothetical protein